MKQLELFDLSEQAEVQNNYMTSTCSQWDQTPYGPLSEEQLKKLDDIKIDPRTLQRPKLGNGIINRTPRVRYKSAM